MRGTTATPVHEQRVVVLNASYELLALVGIPRAVGYLFLDKAESVVNCEDQLLRSAGGFEMPKPLVVRLLRYVHIPSRSLAPVWTRKGLFSRDGDKCAYCGSSAATVDHLQPTSRGGTTTWLNTVAACSWCNSRKADRTPLEAGMPLRFVPTEPSMRAAMLFKMGSMEKRALSQLGLAVA